MKRKVLAFIAGTTLIAGVVTGCGTTATTNTGNSGASSATSKTKIDFIFTGYSIPYFAPMAQAVEQAAKLYPTMSIQVISAHNSSSDEIADIKEAIANNVQGIILNPVNGAVTAAAQQAMSSGVPVITIDRDVSTPSARVAFIGDRDVKLGQLQTQYALQYLQQHHIPTPWNVAILQGTLGSSTAIDRLNGAMDVLNPYIQKGQAKIVFNQSADFSTSNAQQMMSEFLAKTPNIQLVIASNDAMAIGAITALQNAGLHPGKDVFVVGADAQPQSLTDIQNGTQLDTVTHSPYVEAFWAVEAMQNLLASKVKPPQSQFPNGNLVIPMQLVTKSNVSTIAGWGTPAVVPPLPYGKSSAYKVQP
ncbi:sugar ABC transporter substrate-binding protein [Sulfoacidibacillus thermotolerans]|uniref:LacI family transcriptional regulator n=1 Tax=Sulfoacidibacillus thermotolerans TaxID=1765684 RepID=A0A2U3D774_SULT2|nr:sugar ABC transporter substrate-binding protein [Sulfoacidibacillus thermotolerans]PWI57134.1 LacI family transcriptional regulator [Sulfoacidibacillus thermotolerans]